MKRKEQVKKSSGDFTGGIFQQLRTARNTLPSQQRIICEWILNNYQQAAFLTAAEIAKETETSNATVLRTASSLGYRNFTAVKEELQRVLYHASIPPLDRLRDTFAHHETTDILDQVIEENIQNLKGLRSRNLSESFPRAVTLIESARRIYIIGLRSTRGLAVYLQALLHQFLPDVFLVDSYGTENMLDVMMDMSEADVLIALMAGSPHYTKRTIASVRFASERSIRTVLITNSLSSPAAPLATELLLCPQNTTHYSTVSFMTVVDALVLEIGRRKSGEATSKLDKLGPLLVEYDISL
ncbi:MAG: MurR/RpiR family transcriptional regulator [Synergistales bacterium]|nr:MurR/RpiR family transcriptional regulator [Synergistales bacterium]